MHNVVIIGSGCAGLSRGAIHGASYSEAPLVVLGRHEPGGAASSR